MKLIKPFRGVPNGAFYPVDYAKGDECPKELEDAAREAGVLPNKESKQSRQQSNPPESPKLSANDDNPLQTDNDDDKQQNGGENPNGEQQNGGQPNDGENGEQS
ncbi:hypothetical protein MIS33_08485 [Wielerella bovis]|uniref:hypothetical protein n=1 Tax=Wielerella bovis TaxID=2917790 RepID=UPI0020186389|nr:hypothetical protein [Wielerella bovis]ULJ64187.1 hypothetical protein MIS33_08485 [Wielerella bovis]